MTADERLEKLEGSIGELSKALATLATQKAKEPPTSNLNKQVKFFGQLSGVVIITILAAATLPLLLTYSVAVAGIVGALLGSAGTYAVARLQYSAAEAEQQPATNQPAATQPTSS